LDIYQAALRPLLFSGFNIDPELAHHQVMQLLHWLSLGDGSAPQSWLRRQLRRSFCVCDHRLHQSLGGLTFPNPVGLAAGFDKDGVAATVWSALGFGFAELGTVTFQAQPGNPQPRLFRLLPDQAVLNRMGFNNQGAARLAQRLTAVQEQLHTDPMPIGINLGKSKVTPLEEAAMDYTSSFSLLQGLGDYFVVNVSSPNTPGLRSLQASDQLDPILAALQKINQGRKPLWVKIAPDLEWEAISQAVPPGHRQSHYRRSRRD
jgi:dihydroorotate dehydrogenase